MKIILQRTVLGMMTVLFAMSAISQDAVVKVGDMAPDFTLVASDGKQYSLSDYKGKQALAIAFFPKAFTGGCSLQAKSLSDNRKKLAKYDVAYFMASVDTQNDNKRFAKEQHAKFPLLCDFEKEMTQAYGVLSSRGVANRWTIYIDKEGVIQKIDQKVRANSAGPDMMDAFDELGFAKK